MSQNSLQSHLMISQIHDHIYATNLVRRRNGYKGRAQSCSLSMSYLKTGTAEPYRQERYPRLTHPSSDVITSAHPNKGPSGSKFKGLRRDDITAIHRPPSTMLRSSANVLRLTRAVVRPNPSQSVYSRPIPLMRVIGRRSLAVPASTNTSDGPMITPGTPISTPTLIDIDKRWLDLNAQQQLDIFKALHEREKEPWYAMTTEERKACKALFPFYLSSTQQTMMETCHGQDLEMD
jgi:hypothetical protein